MHPPPAARQRSGTGTGQTAGKGASGPAGPAVPAAFAAGGRAGRAVAAALAPVLALVLALVASGPAAALEPLSQERYINDRLISARVADRIRRSCDSLDGRIIYAYTQARALKRYAAKKGYSEAEIEAFLDSKADRARIYAAAEDYLARKGARKDDPDSFCRVGKAEIEARSIIGSLLVAK